METVTVLHDEDAVRDRVEALADAIAARLPPGFVVVGILTGAFVFVADLVRALSRRGVHPRVELIRLGSYGDGTESSGVVRVEGTLPRDLEGRDVLVVDDVLDTGHTLVAAARLVAAAGARKAWLCALVDKPARRRVPVTLDFRGFEVGDVFVVGYGIDCARRHRDLPYLGALE